ncbi:unnamed protein product [Amoebophrya sp. A120]|nr:unnamed protein product [Amoebophrya sp. A120]|eukprot:GSA120T00011059001.1
MRSLYLLLFECGRGHFSSSSVTSSSTSFSFDCLRDCTPTVTPEHRYFNKNFVRTKTEPAAVKCGARTYHTASPDFAGDRSCATRCAVAENQAQCEDGATRQRTGFASSHGASTTTLMLQEKSASISSPAPRTVRTISKANFRRFFRQNNKSREQQDTSPSSRSLVVAKNAISMAGAAAGANYFLKKACPQPRACGCTCVCPELVYVPPPNAIRQTSFLEEKATTAKNAKANTKPCVGAECGPEGCPDVAPCNCYCSCRGKVPMKP